MILGKTVTVVVCVVLWVSFADAFAPPPLAHTSRSSNTAVGLRASAKSAAEAAVPVSRRGAMGRALSLIAGVAVVGELPAEAKPTKATEEDTIAAWNKLIDAQESLAEVKALVEAKDWEGINALLDQAEFAQMEENLLKLVNGPVLNTDDKKTIGTRKRYGIAADVIYGIGGVKGAIENIDNPQIESCKSGTCSGKFVSVEDEVPKSLASLKASLNEILLICKNYKKFVRSE